MERNLLIILFTTLFFSFFNLGKDPIQSFDEARHCVTAIEMMNNGDWFNYYYAGAIDNWNAKPPLGIWSIVLSMKIFGLNAFALRFPSAIATLFIFLFTYQLIRLYENEKFALIVCLIMLSVKGIIGIHVGRTGDFDAMLLAFLMMGIYYFVKYLLEKKNRNLFVSAIAFGISFWVKGPAMVVLFPGLLLFLLVNKELRNLLYQKIIWIAILVLISFPILYLGLMHFQGNQFEEIKYSGSNSVETMFLYDVVERFTNKEFEGNDANSNWDFFPVFLDTKFNLWNYIFYLAITLLLFKNFIAKKFRPNSLKQSPLFLLSICIWFSLGLILTLLNGQRSWYLAPTIPFLAITTYYGIRNLADEKKLVFYLLVGLLCFTLGRQAFQIYHITPEKPVISKMKSIQNKLVTIYLPQTNIEQDVVANAYLLKKKLVFENEVDLTIPLPKGAILLLSTYPSNHDRQLLRSNNKHLILDDFEMYYSKKDNFDN